MSRVLDVLALAHRAVGGVCPDCARDYSDDVLPNKCSDDCPGEQARAAVAELAKAAQDYAWVIENAYDITQTAPALARLRAAIARVGGAA